MKKYVVTSVLAVFALLSFVFAKESSATFTSGCKDCPTVTWSTSRKVCPSGYQYWGNNWCYKHNNHWVQATTETFGPITFKYEKSSDPNHCHRPTASSLNVPSWAIDDFNDDNSEWRDSYSISCPATATPTATATNRPTSTPTATATSVATNNPTATPVETEAPCDDCNEPTATPDPTVAPIEAPFVSPSCSADQHLDAAGKNCVSFGVPGAPTPPPAVGGSVLGASTMSGGQVLGTSTMAGTGAMEDALFNSIFTLGSLLTSFGIMKNGKRKA